MFGLIAQLQGEVGAEHLDACVQYFTQGGPFEWIVGGLFVVASVVFFFSKKSIISVIKGAIGAVMNAKAKK